MTRTAVNRFLVLWLLVTWGAFFLRSDRFPLTWVPMYSDYTSTEVTSHRIVDQDRMRKGLLVTHRDGSTGFVGTAELNIPKWHMYRLYYQRAFEQPPVKRRYGNRGLGRFNRWVRGLEEGEPNFPNDVAFRLFRSLNKTLGYEPDDPRFIVRVQATVERVYRRLTDIEGTWHKTHEADLRWREEWREGW
jgi:hypothetical protein